MLARTRIAIVSSLVIGLASPWLSGAEPKSTARAGALRAVDNGKSIAVTVGGGPFAELRYAGYPKPIVYPIHGPHWTLMVRNYPMVEGTAGEKSDHPHHQSLWFTHDDVNGVGFWHIGKDAGKIVCTSAAIAGASAESRGGGSVERVDVDLANEWRDSKGKVVCTDEQRIGFVVLPNGDRAIDYAVTIKASHGDVVFGDTKEGTMGIRTNPKLRGDKGADVVNSEGVRGDIWGKRAKWVDYSADIDGNRVGVAIFDHPSNPRHPTWWHARAYGLVAANPFGIHNFEKKQKGVGNMKIDAGKSIAFKYRFLFHSGDAASARIENQYGDWAN